MRGEASAPARRAQREVGKRVCGELIDYRVNGAGGWTRYRVTARWRRRNYIWWYVTEVATGARACLAIDVHSGNGSTAGADAYGHEHARRP